MQTHKLPLLALALGMLFSAGKTSADNPLILDQFTADPTARVFDGKIYLFPSHDMPSARTARGGTGWFAMEDYHVFSSENLIDWTDHGVIISQTKVAWVNPTDAMWAPDCVFKNGKYYFYFPAPAKALPPLPPATAPAIASGGLPVGPGPALPLPPATFPATAPATGPATAPRPGRGGAGRGGGQSVGVAIADAPSGPYKPEARPIAGVSGIDPCVFIDKDGQAYLYTALGRISVAKLKDNMLEIASPPQVIANLPTQGQIEGPFTFERNGIYYLTFPHVANKTERLEYAMGKSPMGPFTMTGVIMDESPTGCWTNHHSIVQYKDQWYLFYHDRDLSPDFDKNRSVRADYLSFNDDGTIRKVLPTLRGVGIRNAADTIQIDRYSAVSKDGTAVAFLDDAKKQLGWQITLNQPNAWVQYDRVDFGNGGLKSVNVRSLSAAGGVVEIRLDKPDSPVIAQVAIERGAAWITTSSKLLNAPSGRHDLIVSLKGTSAVALDWVRFE
jgi:hypothetical protein